MPSGQAFRHSPNPSCRQWPPMATSKCVSALLQRTSSRSGTWIETKSKRPRGGMGYSTTTRSSTPLLPPRSISASAAAARHRLVDWIERRPADPHLTLHLANLEAESPDSDQTRLELFNDVLRAGNAAPIVSSEPMPHPLHLRVDRTALIDRADGPLVTVIMPAFNAQETIAAALGSLLAQTHRQLQIIVVDDASSDATVAIAETLAAQDNRISVIAQARNGGAYAARNTGLERAAGAFVTVHDADDWAHPERIERQVRHLEGAPAVPANATHWLRADPSMIFQAHGRHPYKIVGKSTASLMVRRELFGVVGPWDNALRGAADFEFLKRVETRFGAVHHLSRFLPLAVSLRTPGSLTGESATGIRSLWHVNGARRQYLEAFTAWNLDENFPATLPFDSRVAARPFPVPALLTGGKADSSVDVVVTADFTSGSNSARPALHDVNGAVRDGRSVALWHQPDSLDALERRFEPAVVDALRDGRARMLSSGETVHCIELHQHGSGPAGGSLDGARKSWSTPPFRVARRCCPPSGRGCRTPRWKDQRCGRGRTPSALGAARQCRHRAAPGRGLVPDRSRRHRPQNS